MKYLLVVAFQLSIVGSAQACHPYINEYSQGCTWANKHHTKPIQTDQDWYVEITKLPSNWTVDEKEQPNK